MTDLIIGCLIVFAFTLILNIIIDYFVLNNDKKENLSHFIKSITKEKKTLLIYILIEIIEIILFILMGNNIIFYMYYFIVLIFYRIMLIDCKTTYIDNKLLIIFAVISFLSLAVDNGVSILGSVLVGVTSYAILAITSKITHGALGMGDAKVVGLLGVVVGFEGLISILLIASIVVFLVSVVLLIKSRANKNKELPFTPYIFAALILMLIVNNI